MRNRNVKGAVNKSFVKKISLLLNNKDQLSKQSFKNTESTTPINAKEQVVNQATLSARCEHFSRSSVINNGESHNQHMQERVAIKNAIIDNSCVIPTQIWYDSLRETDDGRFSSSIIEQSSDYYAGQ